jgi:hypothetical protein
METTKHFEGIQDDITNCDDICINIVAKKTKHPENNSKTK